MTFATLYNRTPNADLYAWAYRQAFRGHYRIYDPSFALSRDPDIAEKMRRDPVIDSALRIRQQMAAGKKWDIEPGGPDPQDRLKAHIVRGLLENMHRFDKTRYRLAEACFRGAAYEMVEGDFADLMLPGDNRYRRWWVPIQTKHIDKRMLRQINVGGGRRHPGGDTPAQSTTPRATGPGVQIMWEFFNSESRWVELDGDTSRGIITNLYDLNMSTLGYGGGLIEPLYWYFFAKGIALQEGLNGLETWARGWITAKLDGLRKGDTDKTNDARVDATINTLEDMRSRHILVHGEDMDLEVHEKGGQGNEIVTNYINYLDKEMRNLILGANLHAGGGSDTTGSLARAEVEAETSEIVTQFDQASMEEVLSNDLIKLVCYVNRPVFSELGVADARDPKFVIVREKVEDPAQNVQVISAALGAGISLKKQEVYEKIGMEMPQDGEEVIEGQSPEPPPGAPGGGFPPMQFSKQGGAAALEAKVDRLTDAVSALLEGKTRRPFGADWKESDHPRDEDGKFTEGDGGSSGGGAPKNGWDEIGSGSTGAVYTDGSSVYKRSTNDEAEIYSALAGTDGIPGASESDGWIEVERFPYFVDTGKRGGPKAPPGWYRENAGRIASSVTALSDLGYNYADPLQFGFSKDKSLHLLDFSNAEKSDSALSENLSLMSTAYHSVGLGAYAEEVSRISEVIGYLKDAESGEFDDFLSDEEGYQEAKLVSGAVDESNVCAYFSMNARAIPGDGVVPSRGPRSGTLVFSDGPVSPEFSDKYELVPVVVRDAKPDPKHARAWLDNDTTERSTTGFSRRFSFDESKHPRDEDGKFTEGDGASGGDESDESSDSGGGRSAPPSSRWSKRDARVGVSTGLEVSDGAVDVVSGAIDAIPVDLRDRVMGGGASPTIYSAPVGGGRYNSHDKMFSVNIGSDSKDFKDPEYAKKVIWHEFGHALDDAESEKATDKQRAKWGSHVASHRPAFVKARAADMRAMDLETKRGYAYYTGVLDYSGNYPKSSSSADPKGETFAEAFAAAMATRGGEASGSIKYFAQDFPNTVAYMIKTYFGGK